jgi:predicted NAD/FAD-dependent oxidoreductase
VTWTTSEAAAAAVATVRTDPTVQVRIDRAEASDQEIRNNTTTRAEMVALVIVREAHQDRETMNPESRVKMTISSREDHHAPETTTATATAMATVIAAMVTLRVEQPTATDDLKLMATTTTRVNK